MIYIYSYNIRRPVTALHYTSLFFTPLHYTSLHFTTHHPTTLHFTTLVDISLLKIITYNENIGSYTIRRPRTALHPTALLYTPPHDTSLHFTTLHPTTLHFTTLVDISLLKIITYNET
jgi:hypothetical protein